MNLTLGSLFDGIGGFPYAASFFGIESLWASEVLPTAVSVTKRHFPDMEHLGDITQLHGGKLPPVDIITFGSPCQGLSCAGRRLGLADERSGLFGEAIRIIKEMQEETNGEYPKIALWENVPGSMSSSGRLDFKAVLEAFTDGKIPMPRSGRWANAGMVRSRSVDLAWCVYNAQYFGTAQRRRRIFLVAHFTGQRAGEILFVPKSLRRYFAAGGTPWQGAAAYVESGAHGASVGINGDIAGTLDANYGKGTGMRCGRERDIVLCAATGQSNTEILENLSPTLNCNCEQPIIYATKDALFSQTESIKPQAYGICSYSSNSMKSTNPHSGVYEASTARTLDLNGGNPACNQGGIMIVEGGVAILNDQGGISMTVEKGQLCPTLRCETHGNLPVVVHPKICGTLCGSGAGLSRPAGMGSEVDFCIVHPADTPKPFTFSRLNFSEYAERGTAKTLTASDDITSSDLILLANSAPVYCLQGSMIGREEHSGPQGDGVNKEVCFTLNTIDHHAVAAVDCRNLNEVGALSGTLQAKSTAGYSLNYQNPVRIGFTVRRLTPTECERLQGYPDGWTEYGSDGQLISDSRRYQMLGNSIAVPCVAYIMQGIADALGKK